MMGNIRRALGAGSLILAALAMPTVARGEVTVSDLTGKPADDLGPYYLDVNEAIRLFSRGDFAGAYARLQEAKKSETDLAPAEIMMAKLQLSAGQVPAANSVLEKALQVAPGDPEALVILHERAVGEGRLTEASLLFPQVVKTLDAFNDNPLRRQNLQVRAYLAEATLEEARGNVTAARGHLETLLKLDEANAVAHQRLGRLLFNAEDSNQQKAAYAEFKRAAELDKAALSPELMMAALVKDPVQAKRWVDAAIKNNPNDPRTQIAVANHFMRTGDLEQAKQYAAAALKLDANNFDANSIAGLAAQLSGDQPHAVEYLSHAHLLQPANLSITNQLVMALLEMPDEASHAQALQFAELNARSQPDRLEWLATLGWVNFRLKRMAEAERAFKAVLGSRGPGGQLSVNGDTAYMLAFLAAAQGNRDQALQILQPALENKQLFAYRKQAEKLLSQLTQSGGLPQGSALPGAVPAP